MPFLPAIGAAIGSGLAAIGGGSAMAGATLAAGTLAAGGAVASTAMTNSAQKQASADQMNFQEQMSDSAHQREVEDLRAAGLNPILSSKYGGESTPTGAMPQYQNPAPYISQWGQGVSSAVQDVASSRLMTEQIKTQRSQQVLNSAQAVKAAAEADNVRGGFNILGVHGTAKGFAQAVSELNATGGFKQNDTSSRFNKLL